jgi:hypothetical protein
MISTKICFLNFGFGGFWKGSGPTVLPLGVPLVALHVFYRLSGSPQPCDMEAKSQRISCKTQLSYSQRILLPVVTLTLNENRTVNCVLWKAERRLQQGTLSFR